jgi:energy-coupling factor transport system ATP-binding protein
MDEAVKADRIIVMNSGKITKEGTPEQIFNDKEIADAFGADLPCGVVLAEKLREGGMDVPRDIVTEEDLVDYLAGPDKKEPDGECPGAGLE